MHLFSVLERKHIANFFDAVRIVDAGGTHTEQEAGNDGDNGHYHQKGTNATVIRFLAVLQPKSYADKTGNTGQKVDIHPIAFQQVGCPHNIQSGNDDHTDQKAEQQRKQIFLPKIFPNRGFESCGGQQQNGEIHIDATVLQIGEGGCSIGQAK